MTGPDVAYIATGAVAAVSAAAVAVLAREPRYPGHAAFIGPRPALPAGNGRLTPVPPDPGPGRTAETTHADVMDRIEAEWNRRDEIAEWMLS